MPPAELSERIALLAGEEAIAQSGIGIEGPLSRAAVSCAAAARNRVAVSHQDGRNGGGERRRRLSRPVARRPRAAIRRHSTDRSNTASSASTSPSISAPKARRSRSTPRAPRARRAIQLGVEAIRRGECDGGARDRRRRFADAGIAGALLAAFGAVDAERSARAGLKAVLEKPRRLRAGGRRGRAGARKPRSRPRARRARARHPRRLRREIRFVPPHPLEPGRQADHRLHAQGAGRRRRRRPKTSTTSTRTAPRRPRTTRWSISASRPCSANASAASRSRPTNR